MFCCVGNDDDLRAGDDSGADGAFDAVKKGAVFVDNTTASANIARELHAAAKAKGFDFLDAPVSGGQAGAENGALTVMIGGEAAAFERAKPVIAHYARMMNLIGAAGCRPARQDGQPDLHRRRRAGTGRRAASRAEDRASISPR